jgi:hypothetical protein
VRRPVLARTNLATRRRKRRALATWIAERPFSLVCGPVLFVGDAAQLGGDRGADATLPAA